MASSEILPTRVSAGRSLHNMCPFWHVQTMRKLHAWLMVDVMDLIEHSILQEHWLCNLTGEALSCARCATGSLATSGLTSILGASPRRPASSRPALTLTSSSLLLSLLLSSSALSIRLSPPVQHQRQMSHLKPVCHDAITDLASPQT